MKKRFNFFISRRKYKSPYPKSRLEMEKNQQYFHFGTQCPGSYHHSGEEDGYLLGRQHQMRYADSNGVEPSMIVITKKVEIL